MTLKTPSIIDAERSKWSTLIQLKSNCCSKVDHDSATVDVELEVLQPTEQKEEDNKISAVAKCCCIIT